MYITSIYDECLEKLKEIAEAIEEYFEDLEFENICRFFFESKFPWIPCFVIKAKENVYRLLPRKPKYYTSGFL